jgi:hypothetical protein
MAASKNRQKSAPNFVCQKKAIVALSLHDLRDIRLEIDNLATLPQLALIRTICGLLNRLGIRGRSS